MLNKILPTHKPLQAWGISVHNIILVDFGTAQALNKKTEEIIMRSLFVAIITLTTTLVQASPWLDCKSKMPGQNWRMTVETYKSAILEYNNKEGVSLSLVVKYLDTSTHWRSTELNKGDFSNQISNGSVIIPFGNVYGDNSKIDSPEDTPPTLFAVKRVGETNEFKGYVLISRDRMRQYAISCEVK